MFYVRELPDRRCEIDGCLRPATREVLNSQNATIGYYCGRHANAVAARLNAVAARLNQSDTLRRRT